MKLHRDYMDLYWDHKVRRAPAVHMDHRVHIEYSRVWVNMDSRVHILELHKDSQGNKGGKDR